MKIQNKISPAVIQAAVALLSPYVPEISPQGLVQALSDYGTKAATIEKPLTRKEAAEILGVSLPTINRLLNTGTLRRIRITSASVKVDPASVRALLANASDNVEG